MSVNRISGWKIARIVAGVLLLSVVALLVWVASVSARKFAAMEKKVGEMIAEERARDSRRPVLYGTAQPGNAWDDYALAETEMKKFKDASKLGMLVERDPKADPAVGEAALQQHGTALEHLHRGATRVGGRFAYAWEDGSEMKTPALLASTTLANLAVLQSRKLTGRAVAEGLLDICQFGRDFGDDGAVITEMIGIAIIDIGFREIRGRLQARTLDGEALQMLDRGLETLEGSFPAHGRILVLEAMSWGSTMLRSPDHNFFARLMGANCFETVLEQQVLLAAASRSTWAEEQAQGIAIQAEAMRSWNILTRVAGGGLALTGRANRDRRAQIRLLRVGIRYVRSGEVLDLEDPFGARLKTEPKGGKLKVWSVGRDGADDGGDGEWSPSKGKDIVLEVER